MPFLGKTPTKLLDANVNIDGGNIDGTTIGAVSTAPATVSTFTSTGIDDNATSTAITIDSSQNVSFSGDLTVDTNTLYVDSTNNRVNVGNAGTITPYSQGDNFVIDAGGTDDGMSIIASNSSNIFFGDAAENRAGRILYLHSDDSMRFYTNGNSNKMTILSSGNVGIGTDSPSQKFHVEDTTSTSTSTYIQVVSGNAGNAGIAFGDSDADLVGGVLYNNTDNALRFFKSGFTEAMRIDGSGNVLVGKTSSGLTTAGSQITSASILQSASSTSTNLATNSGAAINLCNTSATDGNFSNIGGYNSNGLVTSQINFVNPSHSSRTGAITFTTHSGSAFNEAMRIDSSGNVLVGKTSASITNTGVEIRQTAAPISTFDGVCLYLNRETTDGTLIEFRQNNATEGTISVSGTTVSYNGGHLSRWSQSDIDDVSTIYKGTVMSNLDEMCVWTNEDNEQLNKTKISDVEGDVNVAGVFVAEDNSDDLSDYYLAMTGDMIIRIAQGTTVQRGALLMSAGDGTAKPQDDDIVRSKTIAKVTSTNVTCTYADGSYCVPCVLMAC